MRVAARVAEYAVEAVEKTVGDSVFENLCFFVHLVPGESQGLVQVCFKQAMAAHHSQGDGAPLRGEAHTAVSLVGDEALAGQALDILGRSRGYDPHVFGDVLRLDAVAAGFLGTPHELQDVLHDR